MRTVDLNADLGEGGGHDEQLVALVSSANVACGVHAGSFATLVALAKACRRRGVAFGAHPSGPPDGAKGRGPLSGSPRAIESWVLFQLRLASEAARRARLPLLHVKPHGSLYHAASRSSRIRRAIVSAMRSACPKAALVLPAGGAWMRGGRRGVAIVAEGFADRCYRSAAALQARGEPGAVLRDGRRVAIQALALATGRAFRGAGREIRLAGVRSICLHGDTPGAPLLARAVRAALERGGFRLSAEGRAR